MANPMHGVAGVRPRGASIVSGTPKRLMPLLTLEARIKRGLREHLGKLGFARGAGGELMPPQGSKSGIRGLHAAQREERLREQRAFVAAVWPDLQRHFANGIDVVPESVAPRLEVVQRGTWQAEMFRLAALTWSVPVSQGYGRRMRFLVWDDKNDKLIGLMGLADPVFNLKVRDSYIGWNGMQRRERLVNVMDAFVLGALPPYSALLGGKLVACIIGSAEVRREFRERYGRRRGIISGEVKGADLALVTTASALGRSSIYNRLRLPGVRTLETVGFTSGWGHFHIPERLFGMMREYLKAVGHKYASDHEYGNGANWKMRAVREVLTAVGLRPDILCHGVAREVFACEVASNANAFLRGEVEALEFRGLLGIDEIGALARERWIIPRAKRMPEYAAWSKSSILEGLVLRHTRMGAEGRPAAEA